MKNTADKELEAMGSILRALDGLEGESIRRVLDYVFARLSISGPTPSKPVASVAPVPVAAISEAAHHARRVSIRDLKAEKQPESANQMAALVAYYLSEVVAGEEAKYAISSGDLEKYFKQAGFKLPKALPQTLANAAAAGYFDSVGNGQYKLNAVGYNLVAHALPRARTEGRAKKRKTNGRKKSRS